MAGLVRSPQNNPTQQPLLSDALTQSKRRLRFFGHICRADPNQDHSRALYASTTGLPKHWRRRPGRPRQTWLRTVENDLWSLNLGLETAQRRAQNRTAWQTLVETAPDDDDDDPKTKLFVTVQTYDCQSVHLYKYQTQLKSVFKMSSMCSNASSKTWMPLPDRLVYEHLVEMFPLFDQAWLQLVNVMNSAVIHTLLQLPPNLACWEIPWWIFLHCTLFPAF